MNPKNPKKSIMGQQQSTAYDKQLVALGRVLQTMREEENVDVLIEMTINYIQNEFEYQVIWMALYDRLEHRLLGKGGRTSEGDNPILKQKIILNPGDIMEQVVIQQKAVGVPDLREETRAGEWRKIAQKLNIQGTIVFPIRYKDRCFGVALLGSHLWGVSPKSDEKARLSIILGGLGAALFQIEMAWQRQLIKRPHEPLISLLGQVRHADSLDKCLEAVVEETHQFIKPNRTNIYWFEREKRYFWRRLGNRAKAIGLTDTNVQSASGITVADVSGFYQALISEQIVSIGEAHSSLKADITGKLMNLIRARSLLAAPIIFNNELLGFLAVEGTEPRIWQEEEKQYVKGAAHLIALVAPLAEREQTIQQIKIDQELTAGITRSIYSDIDWKNTLETTGKALCQRLGVERFILLINNVDFKQFEVAYQTQPTNRRGIPTVINNLNDADLKLLEKSQDVITIENWNEDFRLTTWREQFLELGIRSLLVCNTTIGQAIEGILIVGHESSRTWNNSEQEIVKVVSQQLGLILHQWQLEGYTKTQEEIYQSLQWSLSALQNITNVEQLQRSAGEQIAKIIQCPLVVFVNWIPGRYSGRIIPVIVSNQQFAVNPSLAVTLESDFLIQSALAKKGIAGPFRTQDLPPATRQWLSGPGIGQVLVLALRTADDHYPISCLILADEAKRRWSEQKLQVLNTFVSQLAWARRYLMVVNNLTHQQQELENLNWYKQRRIEELYKSVGLGVAKLNELSNQKDALTSLRYQQLLRHIGSAISAANPIIQEEKWRLSIKDELISLASLLRRSLERMDKLIKKRRLWPQVHRQGNLNLRGDIIKLELVVYDILILSARRSQEGGRIDIWCRAIDNIESAVRTPEANSLLITEPSSQFLEIAITDSGDIDPQLLADLQITHFNDILAPSTLTIPPGLHILICKRLIQQMGGQLDIYQLEDKRIVSRLVLPLANIE